MDAFRDRQQSESLSDDFKKDLSMVIQHNMTAFNSNRQLGIMTGYHAKSSEKLASGYKINRAADDAAGLAISEKMRRQIRGLDQGVKNIQDGISVCQIMDGALDEVHQIVQRANELCIKSANATLQASDRQYIQQEISQISQELDRTTKSTTFNEKQILAAVEGVTPSTTENSGKADIIFLIDDTGSMDMHINNVINNINSFGEGLSRCNVQFGVVQFGDVIERENIVFPYTTSASSVKSTLEGILHGSRPGGGDGPESALEAIMDGIDESKFPTREGANKEIILVTDADFHTRTDNPSVYKYEKNEVMDAISASGARLSVVTLSGTMGEYSDGLANGKILNLTSNFSEGLADLAGDIAERAGEAYFKNPEDIMIQMSANVDDTYLVRTYDMSSEKLGLTSISCLTQESSLRSIAIVKNALAEISSVRSKIGADQNCLEHCYNNRMNIGENTSAAESRIRDTDMAAEMVKNSNESILMQAGQSILAQSNQTNQGVLSLLQ